MTHLEMLLLCGNSVIWHLLSSQTACSSWACKYNFKNYITTVVQNIIKSPNKLFLKLLWNTYSNFELISDILQILLVSNSSLLISIINGLASGITVDEKFVIISNQLNLLITREWIGRGLNMLGVARKDMTWRYL